ncbi:MAG: transposase [Candidatus Accumulibacter sp.]|jgi:transposase|nr:transposase [Accumulibacter sp.]
MQGKQHIPRCHYTDDFKAQAVTLASSIGQAPAARKLDLSVKTLSHWVEADRQGRRGAGRRVSVSEMESELARPVAKNLLDRPFAVAGDRPAWVGVPSDPGRVAVPGGRDRPANPSGARRRCLRANA